MLINARQKYTDAFGRSILELSPEDYLAVSKACYYPGYSPLNSDNFDLKIKGGSSDYDNCTIKAIIQISTYAFERNESPITGNSAKLVNIISFEPIPEEPIINLV
jgi:hypothetical protein